MYNRWTQYMPFYILVICVKKLSFLAPTFVCWISDQLDWLPNGEYVTSQIKLVGPWHIFTGSFTMSQSGWEVNFKRKNIQNKHFTQSGPENNFVVNKPNLMQNFISLIIHFPLHLTFCFSSPQSNEPWAKYPWLAGKGATELCQANGLHLPTRVLWSQWTGAWKPIKEPRLQYCDLTSERRAWAREESRSVRV